jgi:hypothetical protein
MWRYGVIVGSLTRLLGVALVVVIVAVGAACTFNPDPTELNFHVRIVNDTPHIIVLSYCGTGVNMCDGTFYDTGRMKPGSEYSTVHASVGQSDPWLIRSLDGERIGCLPVAYDYHADGAVVRVSEAVPCAKHYRLTQKPASASP